jgi:dihydrofolate reductase
MSSARRVVSTGMTRVILDTSMSLDGFMTGPGVTPEAPMGDGGLRLHEWAFDERGRSYLADAVGGLGAVVAGRRTYDLSVPWWGADGPTGAARRPVFVATHREEPAHGVYTFAAGAEAALERAKAAAGDDVVCVMGGADVGRQLITAGLVDEISVHLVPVVLGGGTPMFAGLGRVELGPPEVVATPLATHLRYRVASQTT